MSRLQDALRHFLAVEGVRTAAVIDIATGMIVGSVGKPDPYLPATAVFVADEARAARVAAGAGGRAGNLVEITAVTGSRLQVSRVLQDSPAQGLLLFVDLERGKSNIGLAALRIGELSPAVLALPGPAAPWTLRVTGSGRHSGSTPPAGSPACSWSLSAADSTTRCSKRRGCGRPIWWQSPRVARNPHRTTVRPV